jgi:hypothetical protein
MGLIMLARWLGSKALQLLLPGPMQGLAGMWPLLEKTRAGRDASA